MRQFIAWAFSNKLRVLRAIVAGMVVASGKLFPALVPTIRAPELLLALELAAIAAFGWALAERFFFTERNVELLKEVTEPIVRAIRHPEKKK